MDKPECRLCGAKHWSSEPHVFKTEGPKDARISKKVQRKASAASGPDDVSADRVAVHSGSKSEEVCSDGEGCPLTQAERNARWRKKNPEKYNAYMRDYRRRQRDAQKNN